MRTFRGRVTTPYARGLPPRHVLRIAAPIIEIEAGDQSLRFSTDEMDGVIVVRWSRPWLLEPTSGLEIGPVFFAPVRLSACIRDLTAHGWAVRTPGPSRHVHRLGVVVQWLVMVGFVLLASRILS